MTGVVLVVAGPLLALGIFSTTRVREHDRGMDRFRHYLENRAFALEKEVGTATEGVYSFREAVSALPTVTQESFARVARPLLERHPSMVALEWIPRVAAADLEAHELLGRIDHGDVYRVTEQAFEGGLAPVSPRREYFPILHAEPQAGNEPAIGFDLASEPGRRECLERALQTRSPALSMPVDLIQTPESRAVLLLAPVITPHTSADGGESPGLVCAVFRVSGLVDRSFSGGLPEALDLAHIRLVDDTDAARVLTLFSGDHGEESTHAEETWGNPIEVGGRRWRLGGHPTDAFLAGNRTAQPAAFALSFLFGWVALLALAFVLAKRARDRTEQRQAQMINGVIDALDEGVMVADPHGRFLFANPAAQTMMGVHEDRIAPELWSQHFGLYLPGTDTLFPPDQLPMTLALRGEHVAETEIVVRRRGGGETWIGVEGAPLYQGDGDLAGGVVVFRDITARKRATELVQRLSSAVQQTADAVLITDRQGVIEYVNPAFETMTGYAAHEAIGQTPRLLKSGQQDPRYYTSLWSTVTAGKPFRGSPVNRRKDGSLFHAEQTITPILDRTGKVSHFVSVVRDMTERHLIEEQAVEMRLAASIQARLFPQQPPTIPGYEFAGAAAAALATCGDYYDFMRFNDNRMCVVIADACGHGVGPALVMAQTRAHLRSLARSYSDLATMLDEIDRELLEDLDGRMFVTMIITCLDPDTGTLRWANAGHPTAWILDSEGDLKAELASTGLPLGLLPDRTRNEGRALTLEPGDTVVLLTDGVLEATSPDDVEFGAQRALAVIRTNLHSSPATIVERLQGSVREFAADRPPEDDVTVVVFRRSPSP